MTVVLEGPDGSGKSTLAKRLSEELGWPIYHFGQPTQPPLEEYLHPLVKHPMGHQLILERFHIGEHVYGPLWRGGSALTFHHQVILELALQVRGGHLVLTHCPPGHLEKVIAERGDEHVDANLVGLIARRFYHYGAESQLPQTWYDWTFASEADRLLRKIQSLALMGHAQAERYRLAFPRWPGIGETAQPALALVGERPNPKTTELTREVPFADGPAGEWLVQALDRLRLIGVGPLHPSLYLTNALKADGDDEMVARELEFVEPDLVIALGDVASATLSRHGVPHRKVRHPQYARRFQHRLDYAQHLGEAIYELHH